MNKYKSITDVLWRDGYHAAAHLIAELERTNRAEVELDWMKNYAFQTCFDDEVSRDHLKALWTAYCLHYDLIPDTMEYDSSLKELWEVVEEYEGDTADWSDIDSFDLFLGKDLA